MGLPFGEKKRSNPDQTILANTREGWKFPNENKRVGQPPLLFWGALSQQTPD